MRGSTVALGGALAATGAALVGVARRAHRPDTYGSRLGWLLAGTAAASDALVARTRRRLPALSADRGDFRVLATNVLYTNPTGGAGLASEVRAHTPDVVVAVEADPHAVRELELVLRDHGHLAATQSGRRRILLATSLPVLDSGVLETPGISRYPWVTVRTPSGPVRVVAVHTWAPLGIALGRGWVLELERLARFAEETPGALVLAGDFNATPGHRPFRDLLRRGALDDAVGAVPTFPSGGASLAPCGVDLPTGPVLALDHVLVRGLDVVGAGVGVGAGSDHLPVLADLRVRR
jgi:endonuclease/exonuclease/phosphatase (EEP) superfamily protein YafD